MWAAKLKTLGISEETAAEQQKSDKFQRAPVLVDFIGGTNFDEQE